MEWKDKPPELTDFVSAYAYWWFYGSQFNQPVIVRVNKGVRQLPLPGKAYGPALNFEFFADGWAGHNYWLDQIPYMTGRWAGPIAWPPEWRKA